jgi:hypothetical protein
MWQVLCCDVIPQSSFDINICVMLLDSLYRKMGTEPFGQPAFLHAVGMAIGLKAGPKLAQGEYSVTLGQLAYHSVKVMQTLNHAMQFDNS